MAIMRGRDFKFAVSTDGGETFEPVTGITDLNRKNLHEQEAGTQPWPRAKYYLQLVNRKGDEMLNLTKPIASFDLETTGTDPAKDRIVSIAVVLSDVDGNSKGIEHKVNPGVGIPPTATAVHGISDEDVGDCPSFEDISAELRCLLEGCDLTGYNIIGFDIPLLSAEFKRVGIDWPEKDAVVIDTMQIFRCQEPRKLTNALRFYSGRELGDDAHNALADSQAALDVLFGQAKMYGKETVGELVPLMRDPEWIDSTGKLKWVGDIPVFNFGKHMGTSLLDMAQNQPDYLRWILKKDFPEDFKDVIRKISIGSFPERG